MRRDETEWRLRGFGVCRLSLSGLLQASVNSVIQDRGIQGSGAFHCILCGFTGGLRLRWMRFRNSVRGSGETGHQEKLIESTLKADPRRQQFPHPNERDTPSLVGAVG